MNQSTSLHRMWQRLTLSFLRTMLLLLLLCTLPFTLATASAEIAVARYTVVSGGASGSNTFALVGSIGQPAVTTSNGGGFTVRGGFWATHEDASQQVDHQIYLPHLSR
jgi:hypothetical protein